MMDAGFYKLEDTLLYAQNSVRAMNYSLDVIDHDTYTYPIDGWWYFATKEEALLFFGLTETEDGQITTPSKDEVIIQNLLKTVVLNDVLTQEEIQALVTVYPEYMIGKWYQVDDVFRFEGNLYKVVQAHTSQLDWEPDEIPALVRRIDPAGLISEWRPYDGTASTIYNMGDKVLHNGFTWESIVNENVWEPGVFGWIQI